MKEKQAAVLVGLDAEAGDWTSIINRTSECVHDAPVQCCRDRGSTKWLRARACRLVSPHSLKQHSEHTTRRVLGWLVCVSVCALQYSVRPPVNVKEPDCQKVLGLT